MSSRFLKTLESQGNNNMKMGVRIKRELRDRSMNIYSITIGDSVASQITQGELLNGWHLDTRSLKQEIKNRIPP